VGISPCDRARSYLSHAVSQPNGLHSHVQSIIFYHVESHADTVNSPTFFQASSQNFFQASSQKKTRALCPDILIVINVISYSFPFYSLRHQLVDSRFTIRIVHFTRTIIVISSLSKILNTIIKPHQQPFVVVNFCQKRDYA
jgi:ribosomal protein L31